MKSIFVNFAAASLLLFASAAMAADSAAIGGTGLSAQGLALDAANDHRLCAGPDA